MDRDIMKFTEEELKAYMKGETLIGRGAFGPVHKGTIKGRREKKLNGQCVAIKASRNKVDGEAKTQWRAEIEYLPKVEHQNIIKLIGHCEGQDKFYLVYPFMQNKTVKDNLTGLKWSKTFKIIKGVASAIQKLHGLETPLIHRDLKLDNILLDKDFTPKLADFGRVTPEEDHSVSGTKAHDIYDFGTIILQLITKKENTYSVGPPGSTWKIAEWARRALGPIVHVKLTSTGCSSQAAKKITELGLDCVKDQPSDRPTIDQVLLRLAKL